MPTLRERKKARTRAAIAAAALELFAERGYDRVTLADVAAAADVGDRTVFRHFRDKEELLFAEDEAVLAALAESLDARPRDELPAVAVREAVVSLCAGWEGRRGEGRARQAVIDSAPRLRARERAKHAEYERALAGGLQARGVRRADAMLLARTAVACQHEATLAWLSADGGPGLERRCRAAFTRLAGLLAPLG